MLLGLFVLAGTLVEVDRQQMWVLVHPEAGVELLILVAAAAAATARTFPVPALAVASLLDALPYWLPIGGAGYHLSFMICLYMVVARCPRRTAALAVATVFVLQVGLMAYDFGWLWGHFFVLLAALSVVLPTALGVAARSRQAAVEALEARAEEAERSRDSEARKLLAEDRLRVARDLHDSVAHQIAIMNLSTAVASNLLPNRPEEARQALVTVREAGRSVIASIGDLLTGLREDNWDDVEPDYDLAELRNLVDEFRTLMPFIELDLSNHRTGTHGVGAVTYLVVREGLTNAYKHGDHDAPVHVRLHLGSESDSVRMVNTTRHRTSGFEEGFGLRGMRERVNAAGGRLRVSCTDRTFTMSAQVPARVGTA
ncbi:sensor histidine kinase [Nocardioides sp. SYSU DS0663]|uniref:sensor histidine kinase n=1 Tax=Nocardioides sp. SYSU DS0663 TaxID=3416445 RepID=UPI003F4C01ED